ncbi:MAG: 50S ribosomal protein L25, partial [Actinobacteria bacterium]|nr:50S ribosomal protein L25 [Actinomycetota bacterium]
GADPVSVAVDARELRHALNTDAGVNALVNLSIDGKSQLTMARVLQRHPVRHNVTHVDFQIVNRDEVVSAEVPVNLVGEAIAVHRADGVIEQAMFALTVQATPARIPAHIDIDISGLNVGDSVRIGDLVLPPGVSTDLDPEEAILVAQGAQVSDLDLIPEADIEGLQELAAAEAAAEEADGGGAAAES